MKIALLAPSGAMHRYKGSFARSLHYAPLTLTTLASLVPPELNAQVEIFDETAQFIPQDIDADIMGITVITGTGQRCYKWADYYRSKGITVVLGGIHPTLMPEEAKQHADAVVSGYAEQTWPQLLADFKAGNLLPHYYMDESYSMAGRPIPRRELLKKNKYITMNTVEVIRGCMHTCNFCVIPTLFGNNVWTRDLKDVIAEIEQLPGKHVVFTDVNLVANRAFARKFFTEMIPLKKHWFGLVTSNILNTDGLFDLMVRSGCKGVLIGFESFTMDSLSAVNKGFQKVAEYEELIKKLHDAGIGINGTFVFGSDGDDKSVFEKTVELVQKLKIDLPRYSLYTAFPGSQLYKDLNKAGRIIEQEWAMYDVEHCVVKPAQMTQDELEEGLAWAWKETYKSTSILKRTASLSTQFLLDIPLNIGYRLYANKLHKFTREIMLDNSDIPEA